MWLWEVIKDALQAELISVGDKFVNEDQRFFASSVRVLFAFPI
jgi:hypothetical protein